MDESGLLMAPLVRRTWARRGERPTLIQRARHREKVSVAAGLWLSDEGEPERLSYRTLANSYFNSQAVAAFLESLVIKADRPLTVVWDGGNMHRGDPIRDVLARHRSLRLERLPPYAPMLNPVEQLWGWMKYSRLCNYAPQSVDELKTAADKELRSVVRSPSRIRSFWNACALKTGGHYFSDEQ
jgi:transposase